MFTIDISVIVGWTLPAMFASVIHGLSSCKESMDVI